MSMWTATADSFMETLRAAGLRRAYCVTVNRGGERSVQPSHPAIAELARAIEADQRDFDGHEGIFFEIGPESGHLLVAFVHRTERGQAAGGLRNWSYDSLEEVVRDGLRLSRGMGHKNALSGLWWGGGKGIIVRRPGVDHRDPELREALYRDYGHFVSSLCGCYITAEDVGTTPKDLQWIHEATRFAISIPARVGGSGNPSRLTASGVVVAMEAALEHTGAGSLEGKTVAMQGLGNVANFMIAELLERRVGRIIASDIDQALLEHAKKSAGDQRLELRLVDRRDRSILATPCDILAPNAIGAILNPETIAALDTPIVCGAANNQLEDPNRDAPLLRDRGILYVPDFLANRMGIVNCANEQYGSIENDPAIRAHLDRVTPFGIFRRSLEVFERAQANGGTPHHEAQVLADELCDQLHPMWGHRGKIIIDSLVASKWDQRAPSGSVPD